MKTYSFKTCRGTLKIAADTRFAALRLFKQLVRKTSRSKYIPIARARQIDILERASLENLYGVKL